MKIIALMPVRNEAWILPACLSSLRPLVDEIVAVDDGSTDDSAALIESYGGYVIREEQTVKSGWREHSIREKLLQVGRERAGTHFVCIDADEAITHSGRLRPLCGSLEPGQKLALEWLALWKSSSWYRDDRSVWTNLFKDFVFCDDGCSAHPYASLGVGRTPGPTSDENTKRVSREVSCVLHFQFTPWRRFQMKQAWYRCAELMEQPGSAAEINRKYVNTLDDPRAHLRRVPHEWTPGLDIPQGLERIPVGWHHQAVLGYFDAYGVEFFEPLQIWHVPELKREFIARAGHKPKPLDGTPLTAAYLSYRLRKGLYSRLPARIREHLDKPVWKV